MKNVLIPSDFSLSSIDLAGRVLPLIEDRNIDLIFFHAFSMPTGIYDLLDNRKARLLQEFVSDSFRQSCRRLRQQFPGKLRNVFIRCMQGDNHRVFNNFCEANDVDLIVYPYGFVFTPVHERSVDPSLLLVKTDIPLLRDLAQRVKPVGQDLSGKQVAENLSFSPEVGERLEESVFIKSKQYVVKK